MQSEPVFYIVHIHTPKMDYYALRDSLENAQEEVFLHAQSEWRDQFPGVERPISKVETAERYFQAVRDSVYFHIVDIESEGNWVMDDSNQSNSIS
jgi:hypothetical protein